MKYAFIYKEQSKPPFISAVVDFAFKNKQKKISKKMIKPIKSNKKI
jgi:hypothetical protein